MCLHDPIGPKIVKRPILVYKRLILTPHTEKLRQTCSEIIGVSPYRYTNYYDKKLQISNLKKHGEVVEQGLHAYIKPSRFDRRRYPAIIPVGATVYYNHSEIASTQLIVYKDMNSLHEDFPNVTLEQQPCSSFF